MTEKLEEIAEKAKELDYYSEEPLPEYIKPPAEEEPVPEPTVKVEPQPEYNLTPEKVEVKPAPEYNPTPIIEVKPQPKPTNENPTPSN